MITFEDKHTIVTRTATIESKYFSTNEKHFHMITISEKDWLELADAVEHICTRAQEESHDGMTDERNRSHKHVDTYTYNRIFISYSHASEYLDEEDYDGIYININVESITSLYDDGEIVMPVENAYDLVERIRESIS